MAEEQARVIAADDTTVTLQLEQQKGCHSCELSSACGTASLGRLLGFRGFDLKLDNDAGLKVGDKVILSVSDHAVVMASLLIYLFPLLGMFVGASLVYAAGASEFWVIVAAAIGLFSALRAAGYLARFSLGKALQPKLSRQLL